MSFLIASFLSNLKRLIKPSTLIITIIPAVSLAIGGFVQKELIMQARVGVMYDASSAISREVIENLEKFSNINIRKYDELDELLDDIASVKVECGYVFDKDIDKYIETGAINRAAKLYKSKSTMADGFTNELVFAALMKTAAPYISANYLRSQTGEDYDTLVEEAEKAVQSYYDSDVFMDMEFVTIGAPESADEENNRINAGIISVFLFVTFFYITIGGIEEKKKGLYEKLSGAGALSYIVTYVLAYAVLLYTVVSFMFVSDRGIAHSMIVTGIYIVVLSACSVAAVLCLKSAHALYALFPIISITVITLGGAFFDLGVFSPVLGQISRLFPTYYFVIYML